jgi:hypothetical protein
MPPHCAVFGWTKGGFSKGPQILSFEARESQKSAGKYFVQPVVTIAQINKGEFQKLRSLNSTCRPLKKEQT